MADREKIIERIKKLLAVTEKRGATEAEALAAALAAQRLIADNDVHECELADEAEPIVSVVANKSRSWQDRLATVVAENFRCRWYWCHRRQRHNYVQAIAFYGYESDANAAKLVFKSLAKTGNRLGKHYADDQYGESTAALWESYREREIRLKRRNRAFNSWCAAFVRGVSSELEKQSQALLIVVPPAVKDAYRDFSEGFKTSRSRFVAYCNSDAENAGFAAGRDAVRAGRIGSGGDFSLPA